MEIPKQLTRAIVLSAIFSGLTLSGSAFAQGTKNVFLEEIIVTATKRAGGMAVQDVPVAVTAYGESQLDAMYIRDLKAVGYSAPSVQLEDIGTTRGVANFSIRGLGINSSIPSIDPTVGVFVDGMYMGLNAGVVFDIFDMEGIEVLRGPQGILFGRNVTGGAVLIRTTRPTDELSVNARVAYESGSNMYLSTVVSGPLSDRVGGKLAVYYNDDGGWFNNLANGNDNFGKASTKIYRGALSFEISESMDLIVRGEHADTDGDGPASQNAGLYREDSFDFSVNEEGFYDNSWDNLIAEFTWDVGPGDGQIVNILGWREYESLTRGDIDASPIFFFHAPASTFQNQMSNELRYTASIGESYLTAGLYYFRQDIEYRENRIIPPSSFNRTGGGDQAQDTLGFFANLDFNVTDDVTFNLGARYTEEKKDVKIRNIPLDGCVVGGGCLTFNYRDNQTWSSVSPKVGVQITPSDETQIYAFWTKGFRSGGYNLRHTAVAIPNEPFDQEEQSSYEIGLKRDLAGGRVRINAAAYLNKMSNLQREINLSDPFVGVIQLIRNTSDATITGFDLEASAALSDNLFLRGSFGYVDGSYDEVRFDLNGDGVVDSADKQLDMPRLAPKSYGAELIYTREVGFGTFTAQASGYHRDSAAYTDNNRGRLRAADMFDASVGFTFMEERLKFSIFGKNLKNESTIGGDTQLPAVFPGGPSTPVPGFQGSGATFSPLNKGRIYGLELQYRM
ncbi:MAG: TonB-dependent receptor [Gammaproteobacteria bacterium]|nr:TonB-dependent receptor [Gammaproteobacteria bacterium]MDH4313792.1 TonB-dependent receptor [Gammaproteobacteria bacterium]MDH5215166.1 TonB-dependent receptor [Gammaproteobacteria bacterium]